MPHIEREMTLLMWRNHFTCDILAENGTAHIESLCKWGPSVFTHRTRVLPSGRPPEESVTLIRDDPTWDQEYARSEEHTSELQSLMRISYAVFCLQKKKNKLNTRHTDT